MFFNNFSPSNGTSCFRIFGVTKNSMYLPNIIRVCASIAGMEPNTEDTIGLKIHCQTMDKDFQRLYSFGRGGNSTKLTYMEKIRKKVAILMIARVRTGRFRAKTVVPNLSPPKISGNQPKRAIMMEAVAQK